TSRRRVTLDMAIKDPYTTLGIARDADAAAIKKAFRKLAQQYHPDRHKGSKAAEEKFKEINEAYQILTDPKAAAAHSRAQAYEQAHTAGRQRYSAQRPRPGAQQYGNNQNQ